MYLEMLDRIVPAFVERQVLDTNNVELTPRWSQWIDAKPGTPDPSAVVGAFWDQEFQASCFAKSQLPFSLAKDPAPYYHQPKPDSGSEGKIKIVEIVLAANAAWLFLYLHQTPQSLYYRDDTLRERALLALDMVARAVLDGAKIRGCFDLGLIFFCEAFFLLKASLEPERLALYCKAIERASVELGERMQDEWLVYFGAEGQHNHQLLTAHSILLSGLALEDEERITNGTSELIRHLGYFGAAGYSDEHDRKYEYFTCGPLLRAAQLTGRTELFEAVRRAAKYGANFITPSGELVELISLRPTGSGGGWGYGCACFVYEQLASAERSAEYKALAIKLQRYLGSRQRQDGLFQGMIYSPDPTQNVASMCAFFNTGYNIHGLIWAHQSQSSVVPSLPPPHAYFDDAGEKLVAVRNGSFAYYGCGANQGPRDLLWVDHKGPGIVGFAARLLDGDSTYGGFGGFTPDMVIDDNYWDIRPAAGSVSVWQRLAVGREGPSYGDLRFATLIEGTRVLIFAHARAERGTAWVTGPNVRSSIGSAGYVHGGARGLLTSLAADVPVIGAADIVGVGRHLRIQALSGPDSSFALTAPIVGELAYLHLIPGRVNGAYVTTPAQTQDVVWVIDGEAAAKCSIARCSGEAAVQAVLISADDGAELLIVNHDVMPASVVIEVPLHFAPSAVRFACEGGKRAETDWRAGHLSLQFNGRVNPNLEAKSITRLRIAQ